MLLVTLSETSEPECRTSVGPRKSPLYPLVGVVRSRRNSRDPARISRLKTEPDNLSGIGSGIPVTLEPESAGPVGSGVSVVSGVVEVPSEHPARPTVGRATPTVASAVIRSIRRLDIGLRPYTVSSWSHGPTCCGLAGGEHA